MTNDREVITGGVLWVFKVQQKDTASLAIVADPTWGENQLHPSSGFCDVVFGRIQEVSIE